MSRPFANGSNGFVFYCYALICYIWWLVQGWVIIRDTAPLIESARALTTRLKWDARVVETESNSEERLLICQKPFFKRQASWEQSLEEPQVKVLGIQIHFVHVKYQHKAPPRKGDTIYFEQKEESRKIVEEKENEIFWWDQPQLLWSRKAYIGPCNYFKIRGTIASEFIGLDLNIHVMSQYNNTTTWLRLWKMITE